jgi:hypothetical protein
VSSLAPSRPLPLLSRLAGRLQLGRHKGLVLAGLLLVGLAPPAYLLQTGGALSTGYTIQRLQHERTQWIVKNDQLGAEIARARSLAWVEAEAVNRLGMQRPTQQTAIRVDVPPPSPAGARAAAGARAKEGPTPDATATTAGSAAWTDWLGAVLANVVAGR